MPLVGLAPTRYYYFALTSQARKASNYIIAAKWWRMRGFSPTQHLVVFRESHHKTRDITPLRLSFANPPENLVALTGLAPAKVPCLRRQAVLFAMNPQGGKWWGWSVTLRHTALIWCAWVYKSHDVLYITPPSKLVGMAGIAPAILWVRCPA